MQFGVTVDAWQLMQRHSADGITAQEATDRVVRAQIDHPEDRTEPGLMRSLTLESKLLILLSLVIGACTIASAISLGGNA